MRCQRDQALTRKKTNLLVWMKSIVRIPVTECQYVSPGDPANDFDWTKEYLKRFKATQSLPEAYIENIQPKTDASSQ